MLLFATVIIPDERDDILIADQEQFDANVNEQKFPAQKQPKSTLRTIIFILAFLIATGISLYIWIGPFGISHEQLINIWVIIKDIVLNR